MEPYPKPPLSALKTESLTEPWSSSVLLKLWPADAKDRPLSPPGAEITSVTVPTLAFTWVGNSSLDPRAYIADTLLSHLLSPVI